MVTRWNYREVMRLDRYNLYIRTKRKTSSVQVQRWFNVRRASTSTVVGSGVLLEQHHDRGVRKPRREPGKNQRYGGTDLDQQTAAPALTRRAAKCKDPQGRRRMSGTAISGSAVKRSHTKRTAHTGAPNSAAGNRHPGERGQRSNIEFYARIYESIKRDC